jgi:hypothetical protein
MFGSSLVIGVWVVVALLLVVTFGWRMPCHVPIGTRPYRGCRHGVWSVLGKCRVHRRRPSYRVIARLGGRRLAERRICNRCGKPTTFGRLQGDGVAYIGCTGYPACKNARRLNDYRA